jgi:hypothetical protein
LTTRVAVEKEFALFLAVIIKTSCPINKFVILQFQDVVPVQLPLPPRLFIQVTALIPDECDAVPDTVIELTEVLYEEPVVGDVMAIAGGVNALLSVATAFPPI